MEVDEGPILDAVIGVVSRYGIKRTTMDEMARQAAVSRQTLYDRFGDKDGIFAAAIAFSAKRMEEALRAGFAQKTSLGDNIDVFYSVAVLPVYELFRRMPDAADLEKGLGANSKAASKAATQRRQEILARMFAEHVSQDDRTPEEIAVFFDQSCSRAKLFSETAEDLETYLSLLKASTVALIARGTVTQQQRKASE
jgi:AcrR family transcriptional regulator